MKKTMATAALTASLLTGGVLFGSTSAFAQDDVGPADDAPAQEADTPEGEGRGHHNGRRGARLANLAETLGMEVEDLRAALSEGSSLADVAEANGVSVDDLVDSIVDNKTDRIEAAVEAGRLTDEEATEKLVDLEDRVTERVNSTDRFERRGARGNGGPAADDAVDTTGNAVADAAVNA